MIGWGSLCPATKPALREATPVMIAFARAFIACLLLSALSCIRSGGLLPGLRHLRRQGATAGRDGVVLGVLSFAGTTLLAVGAQQYLPASVNTVLNNLGPLWVAIYATVAGHAGSAPLLIGGSALAALGVAMVVIGGADTALTASAAHPGRFALGAAISLSGSLLIAVTQVLARRLMPRRDPLAVTAVAAGWGALPLFALLVAGAGGSLNGFAATSLVTRGLLLWLGAMSTAFNFSLWYFALAHLPLTRIAHFQYLITPLGVALSVLLLAEPAGPGLLAGTAVILAGIALAQRGAEPAQ
jgi:drug/metabolite transporter (DMT)-like permease